MKRAFFHSDYETLCARSQWCLTASHTFCIIVAFIITVTSVLLGIVVAVVKSLHVRFFDAIEGAIRGDYQKYVCAMCRVWTVKLPI